MEEGWGAPGGGVVGDTTVWLGGDKVKGFGRGMEVVGMRWFECVPGMGRAYDMRGCGKYGRET